MRYKVVVSKNITEFQKLCSDLIEAGYDPVGTFTTSNKEYLQAFVKTITKPVQQYNAYISGLEAGEFNGVIETNPDKPQVQLGRPNAIVDYSEPKEEPPKRVGRPPKSTSLS